MSLLGKNVDVFIARVREALSLLDGLPDMEKIRALNEAKLAMTEKSPMRGHPVDAVIWVPVDSVTANDYNPNNVAPPEMRLLELSIREDGYTMPSVVTEKPDGGHELIDGFHRRQVAAEKMRSELHGLMPVSRLNKPYDQRMASTIRHNRARGVHAVSPMTDIVASLSQAGWGDKEIGRRLGMDKDEVLRLKQCSGLADLFKDREFSPAWE